MALEEEIATAIEKNLPEQVGSTLRRRLEAGENDRKRADLLENEVQQLRHLKEGEDTLKTRTIELENEMKNVEAGARSLEQQKEILKVKEDYNRQNRDVLISIVTEVFKGPASKMAFTLDGYANQMGTDQYGNSMNPSVNLKGDLETKDDG